MDVVFYVAYPYYFPHFLPISRELEKEGMSVHYLLSDKQNSSLMKNIAEEEGLNYSFGEENLETLETKVIMFANVPDENLQTRAKKIFLCHGTGTKQCGFENALKICDIVLVEGIYRFELYTKKFEMYAHKIKKVGYSKLDTVLNTNKEEAYELKKKYGLDTNKKTILYAPTFFPSSIEKMSNRFPDDLSEYNILIKPHYLSWERKRYKQHRQKFNLWEQYDNCSVLGVDEYSLVPFMMLSDIMISDESSAIFEFASLNKPVIINRFLKLRWSYYLNPKKLLKRMDKDIDRYRVIGENPNTYEEMLLMARRELEDNSKFEKERLALAEDICGKLDGKASSRIVHIIKEICGN